MSCGFCHVGPNPLRPPGDPENPEWAQPVSSNVGAQFFWVDRIFNWQGDTNQKQLLQAAACTTSRPGSLDTSLVSHRQHQQPADDERGLPARAAAELAKRWGKEKLAGGELDNKQFNDFVPAGHPLAQFFEKPNTVYTPRVLKDGSDSVGALGALNRVYLNIGLFSEEWLLHFRPIIGGKPITPIQIADAEKNSRLLAGHRAADDEHGAFFLAKHRPAPSEGRAGRPGAPAPRTPPRCSAARMCSPTTARAATRASCPICPPGIDLENNNGKNYLDLWNNYWAYTKTPEFKAKMRAMVLAPDFLDGQLSCRPSCACRRRCCRPTCAVRSRPTRSPATSGTTSRRRPTRSCPRSARSRSGIRSPAPSATSSLPGGGRGFTRPASLVSLWSTAPFLQNNSRRAVRLEAVGRGAAERLRDIDRADALAGEAAARTTSSPSRHEPGRRFHRPHDGRERRSWVPRGYVPALRRCSASGSGCSRCSSERASRSGRFPKFPVRLLANADLMGADLTGRRAEGARRSSCCTVLRR